LKERFDDDEKNLHRDFEGPDFKFCLFIPVSVKSTSNLLAEKKEFANDSCRHKEMPFEAHSLIECNYFFSFTII
jgi:hypothetical protein